MSSATERARSSSCCDDPEDAEWGRRAGAVPPLAWWWPALVAVAAAAVLAVIVVFVVRDPGPLDNPDPGRQRNGLLLSGPTLPAEIGGVQLGGRPVVLLFERRQPSGPEFDSWRSRVEGAADLVVLTAGPRASQLADAVQMPQPVDGGPPVGYAVIDPSRTVRYATLDPAYLRNAFEVEVIAGAVA